MHYEMTSELRTYEAFVRSLRSFDWLEDTDVSGACDVDLMLERRGRFLFIEGKPREGPRIHVPIGQWIALRTLSSLPGVDVWVVAEDDHAKEDDTLPRYSVLTVRPDLRYHTDGYRNGQKQAVFYTDKTFTHVTLRDLQQMVNEWWAESA